MYIFQIEINKTEEKFLSRLPQEDPTHQIELMQQIMTSTRQSQATVITDTQSVTAASAISQIKIDPSKLQILQFLYSESENYDKSSHLIGAVDDYTIYSEFDIFPGGLPDIEDIRLKKKKSTDEK